MRASSTRQEKGCTGAAPRVFWVFIGRVVDPARAPRRQPVPHLGPPRIQHRPQQHQPPPLRPGGRRRPVPQSANRRTLRPHQRAFGDVVGGVGEQDDLCSGLARRLGDQAVAGAAGGDGQAGERLGTGPAQTAPVGADIAGGLFGEGGPAGAFGAQAVVDGQRQQPSAVRPRPVGGQVQQGDGVAATGQGEGDRMTGAALQPGGQAVPDRRGPIPGRRGQPGRRAGVAAGAAQPMRVRASAARVRTAGVAASA